MEESQTDWLRQYMRDRMAALGAANSTEGILLPFPHSPKINPGAAALELVHQVAELIQDIDNSAAEKQARAESLVSKAIEKLKLAQDQVDAANAKSISLEAEVRKISDQFESELKAAESVIERTKSRIAAAEAELSAANHRAKTAEERALAAESALKRIEQTLRTKVLERKYGQSAERAA